MKYVGNDPLYGYLDMPIEEINSLAAYIDRRRVSNCKVVNGVGVHDFLSEKGLIPLIAFELQQPFYARKVRESVAGNDIKLVAEGRPDAMLSLASGFESRIPQFKNKMRQLAKAKRELTFVNDVSGLNLPWKTSTCYLRNKYDGVHVPTTLPDEDYAPPSIWTHQYSWCAVLHNDCLLGAANFLVSDDGSEAFWVGSILDYSNPLVASYSVGNVLLMEAILQAKALGIEQFNMGIDFFPYKPAMWGTTRVWDTGLEYIKD